MYATVEQANDYVQKYYSSTDSLRRLWESLSDEDKQVQLNRAEQQIDLLPFTGRPLGTSAFPREPFKDKSLQAAQVATIELAVQRCDSQANERYELQKQGVQSYKIGDLSETFKGGSNSSDVGADAYIMSVVFPFLKDWLGGSFEIRGRYSRCRTRIFR